MIDYWLIDKKQPNRIVKFALLGFKSFEDRTDLRDENVQLLDGSYVTQVFGVTGRRHSIRGNMPVGANRPKEAKQQLATLRYMGEKRLLCFLIEVISDPITGTARGVEIVLKECYVSGTIRLMTEDTVGGEPLLTALVI